MAFTKEEQAFVEAYYDEMMPKIITEHALRDIHKGVYSPPVWPSHRDEFIRTHFGERGVSPAEIENMIKVGRENFKSIIAYYNKKYKEYQQHEAQAA